MMCPNHEVMAVFQARAATTPNATLTSEIIVARNSLLKRLVFCTTTVVFSTTWPTSGIPSRSASGGGCRGGSLSLDMRSPPSLILACDRTDYIQRAPPPGSPQKGHILRAVQVQGEPA